MGGQLPRVQNATEKMHGIQLSVTASTDNWQMPSYTQFITSLHENYLYLLFSSTRLFYSWITFSITFMLHISQSPCQHSWSAISAACIAPAVKHSPVKPQPWRSGHRKLHYWVQPTPLNLQEKHQKLQRTIKNEIYDKVPWKCQSRIISEILIFTFSFSFIEASKENRDKNSSLKSSFLPTVHMATNPAPQGFSRLKNLLVKLTWLCYFTSI